MTFADLPRDWPLTLCPEVFGNLRRAFAVSADLDLDVAVWCGICRFQTGHRGRLGDLLAEWPMLGRQDLPEMGQRYERAETGKWFLREDLG